MSLVDIDSWIIEYEACERLSRDIQTQIVSRNREPKLSEEYSNISATVRIRLRQFSTELNQLQIKLEQNFKNGKLTFEEQERRQRQIESLQSTLIHLEKQFSNAGETSRSQLFQSGGSRLWDDDDNDDHLITGNRPNSSNITTTEDFRKHQKQMLEHQNDGLESLAKVISRQKELALKIGDEVDDQNEIIDDLAITMERTDDRVNHETQHIGIITRKDSTCGYWIVIIILFIAICITALL